MVVYYWTLGACLHLKSFFEVDKCTVKPLNFPRDLISLISQVMKIRKIKYPRKFNSTLTETIKLSDL